MAYRTVEGPAALVQSRITALELGGAEILSVSVYVRPTDGKPIAVILFMDSSVAQPPPGPNPSYPGYP